MVSQKSPSATTALSEPDTWAIGEDDGTMHGPSELDLDGAARLSGPRIDMGADELTCGDGTLDLGEACDDGNATDGDDCDSNCTLTACGNGIVTAGEACDDGN